MPIKDNREYRSVATFKALEMEDGSESMIVEGYATTFDQPYDFGWDGMKEMIKKSALDDADLSDVIFQMNHDGAVLARQRNGSLGLTIDDHGLHVRADLSGSQAGRDLYEAIRSGLMDKMSWGFIVARDGWEYDHDTRTSIITRVDKVFDVSAVSLPANEDTEIKARSYINGVIEAEQQELLQRSKDKEEREKLATLLRIQ